MGTEAIVVNFTTLVHFQFLVIMSTERRRRYPLSEHGGKTYPIQNLGRAEYPTSTPLFVRFPKHTSSTR